MITKICALALGLCALSQGATYYIDGSSGNDYNNPGTLESPWKTIWMANITMQAGDTAIIKAGTYYHAVSPTNSGTASDPIVYRNFEEDSVFIGYHKWNQFGIYLKGVSHIEVNNIHVREQYQHLIIDSSHSNTIKNCSFSGFQQIYNYDSTQYSISWHGSWIHNNSTKNKVQHCEFSNYGWYGVDNSDNGVLLNIGSESWTYNDQSDSNLVENSVFYHGGHHVLGVNSKNNVIRNNFFRNEQWTPGEGSLSKGNRIINLFGGEQISGRNLIENNVIAFTHNPPDDNGASGIKIVTPYNIVRNNTIYHCILAGISLYTERGNPDNYGAIPHDNYIYNNTFFNNGFFGTPHPQIPLGPEAKVSIGFCANNGAYPTMVDDSISDNRIINNIFSGTFNNQTFGFNYVDPGNQVFRSNWMDTSGAPQFVDVSAWVDSMTPLDTTNIHLYDFRLKNSSPAIDAGSFLTTITSESGTGTSFEVADARFFTDGWDIVEGDNIQLEARMGTITIIDIDYDLNLLTVNEQISWKNGQGVALTYDGEKPDLGAIEYKEEVGPQK